MGAGISRLLIVWSYVFNTTQEDQRVSKTLSGWKPNSHVPLESLGGLDTVVVARLRVFQGLLFNTCTGLHDKRLNVCREVLDVCTSRLLRATPQLRSLNPDATIIRRVDCCAEQAGISRDDMLAISFSLDANYKKEVQYDTCATTNQTAKEMDPQTVLIRELLDANRRLVDRLDALEKKSSVRSNVTSVDVPLPPPTSQPELASRKRTSSTRLSSVWFEWYAGEPRLWSTNSDRKRKSDASHIVAYMKLFLTRGFMLNEATPTYRDDVMRLGSEAELGVVTFLQGHGVRSAGSSAVLKHMRSLHKKGLLDRHLREYESRRTLGLIVDPSPSRTRIPLSSV